MQVRPDWSKCYNSKQGFEDDLGLEFKGPGFYLTKTDTLLCVPLPPDNPATLENIWNVEQPAGTIYECNVYNLPFSQTIYAACAIAPVRLDER